MWDQGKVKTAVINYLSLRVNPMNIKGLQETLKQQDASGTGELPSDQFIRCLSKCQMKFMDDEVENLIDTIVNKEKINQVNYIDFLKFSYLFQLYKNHMQLENDLKELDAEKTGLITVSAVDKLLQDESK